MLKKEVKEEVKKYKKKELLTFFVSDGYTSDVNASVNNWLKQMYKEWDEIELISSQVGTGHSPNSSDFRYKDISCYGYKY